MKVSTMDANMFACGLTAIICRNLGVCCHLPSLQRRPLYPTGHVHVKQSVSGFDDTKHVIPLSLTVAKQIPPL